MWPDSLVHQRALQIHRLHPFQLIFYSAASNLTLTMLCLGMGAGVGVHIKFTGWRVPKSTHPYPEAKLALCWNWNYNHCFTLLLLLPLLPSALCSSLQSELLALVWALQPASSAQPSTAVLHLSEWAEWESEQGERESIAECRVGGRREREKGAVSTLW